jgi:hypothetical protein
VCPSLGERAKSITGTLHANLDVVFGHYRLRTMMAVIHKQVSHVAEGVPMPLYRESPLMYSTELRLRFRLLQAS